MKIYLRQSFFSDKEKLLLETSEIKASIFNYESGVEAIRIRSELWEMIWLPFLGQQVWDFSVHGKSIKMHSPVHTPSRGLSFLENYGAMLLHCGISGMGNPSPQDTHPLHGELPAAPFQSAWVVVDNDRLVLGGTYSYKNTYGLCYDFSPQITLDCNKTWFSVKCTLMNTRKRTIPYQYLAHINLLPEFNDRILSTAVLSRNNVMIRKNPPEYGGEISEYESFYNTCSKHPEDLKTINESHIYDPELVLWFREDRPISDDLCYSVLQKNDKEAVFVSYDPKRLDHAIRWISINPDFQAAGILLPATAETEGFLKEEAKGNIKYLNQGESVDFIYNTGMMMGSELQSLIQKLK
jgi:hypothetical protein